MGRKEQLDLFDTLQEEEQRDELEKNQGLVEENLPWTLNVIRKKFIDSTETEGDITWDELQEEMFKVDNQFNSRMGPEEIADETRLLVWRTLDDKVDVVQRIADRLKQVGDKVIFTASDEGIHIELQ